MWFLIMMTIIIGIPAGIIYGAYKTIKYVSEPIFESFREEEETKKREMLLIKIITVTDEADIIQKK